MPQTANSGRRKESWVSCPSTPFGHLFRVTTWGESHGPALGATVDGCPPGVPVTAEAIQHWLDRRKPGQNKYTTQRREADEVEILSGVFEGQSTGTPSS
jgi:chorismate synthase